MELDMKQKYNLVQQIKIQEKKKKSQTVNKGSNFVAKRETNHHESDQQKQKYKLSKIQTNTNAHSNYSRNQVSNLSLKSPIHINKRIKTQSKSKQLSASHQNGKIKTITKRLKTDVSQRYQSPALAQQRFEDDHYNTASLAELLQFHTGYNEIDQAQFNYRVRKQTQGSKMQEKQQKQQKSEKNSGTDQSGSVIKVNIDDDEIQIEDQQENAKESKNQKNIQESLGKQQKVQNGYLKPQQDQKSQKDSNIVSHYTLGATLGLLSEFSEKKQQFSNIKKKHPKIRSFSLEQKFKIISENKYIPKTEEEIRMEARYLKSQIHDLNLYKQTQEMIKYLSQYQKSKKILLQQAAKKYEINRMMQNLKLQSKKIKEIGIKKSISLPKIKQVQQFMIPQPHYGQNDVGNNQEMMKFTSANKKLEKTEQSLSISRLQYKLNKQKCQKEINRMKEDSDSIRIETENVEYIQNVLRKKGVQFDGNTLRKGLINLRPKANNIDGDMRFEIPKSLISNPKYQKYPL